MNYRLTELKVLLFLLLLPAVSCQRPMYDEDLAESPQLIIRPISMRLQRTAAVLPV